jgi:hypothetical protein
MPGFHLSRLSPPAGIFDGLFDPASIIRPSPFDISGGDIDLPAMGFGILR